MIQRIQTLYLLIIAALMAVTLFSGLAWFAGDAGEFGLYAFGLKTAEGELVQSTVYMGVLLALACALPLVTVFLFRRRLLQIRLCVVEMVLLLGSLVMEGVYYFLSWRVFSDLTFHTQGCAASGLPAVCLFGGPCDFPRRTAGARSRQNTLIERILLTRSMPERMFRVFCPRRRTAVRTEKGCNSDRSDY